MNAMTTTSNLPHKLLNYYVTGAIERGESEPITEIRASPKLNPKVKYWASPVGNDNRHGFYFMGGSWPFATPLEFDASGRICGFNDNCGGMYVIHFGEDCRDCVFADPTTHVDNTERKQDHE